MIEIYNTILYEPILNAMIYFYHVLPGNDLGIAIIVLTLIIKLLLFSPSLSALKAQKSLQDTQPKVAALREKYKDDKEEMGKQLMAFYKENKVNPFASCLPLLIQLPILIALYQAFLKGLDVDATTHLLNPEQVQHLYGWLAQVYATTPLDTTLFGVVDLSATHNVVLAILAAGAAFFQGKTMQSKRAAIQSKGAQDENTAAMISKQMMYLLPIITLVFGYQFPAGVTLYWFVSTLFSVGQQLYFFRLRQKWQKKDTNENNG